MKIKPIAKKTYLGRISPDELLFEITCDDDARLHDLINEICETYLPDASEDNRALYKIWKNDVSDFKEQYLKAKKL
jgi:hypothetical protein